MLLVVTLKQVFLAKTKSPTILTIVAMATRKMVWLTLL
jgi:hypothetical protein